MDSHLNTAFSFFPLTITHTVHTRTYTHMSVFSHCISLSPFSLCCALVSLHWTLTRGGMMEQFSAHASKHTQTHTLIHKQGFSRALRGDRVVCLALIGAIQAIQHGERARERHTGRQRERPIHSLFWILGDCGENHCCSISNGCYQILV